jgi:hypothetical protein
MIEKLNIVDTLILIDYMLVCQNAFKRWTGFLQVISEQNKLFFLTEKRTKYIFLTEKYKK